MRCLNAPAEQVGEACICRLSHAFESLREVRQLSLANNGLASLPPSLWRLRSLQALDLSFNKLTEVPEDILGLENLEVRSKMARV